MNTDFRVASLPVASIAELDRLGDEIAELSAHLDAATAHLLDLIRDFDVRGGWGNGFRSCAAWLTWRIGLDRGAARERVRVARALGTLPRLAQALARGELSYAKVRAVSGVATPEPEERLLGVGRAGTAEHVERGAVLIQALAAARERRYRQTGNVSAETFPADASMEPPTMAQQQADALGLIAETALHHGMDPGSPGERYQVVGHVDAAVLEDPEASGQSALEPGAHVSAETSRRLGCDASRVVMRHDPDGRVVEVGALTRTIPAALRRGLPYRGPGGPLPGGGPPLGPGGSLQPPADGGPPPLASPDPPRPPPHP